MKTTILDEYREKKRQQAENLRTEMLAKIKAALSGLSKVIYFEKAYAFGSILKPAFSEASDIDIAFVGLKDEDFFRAMAFLSDFLGKDVDIIQIEGHRLREKVLKEGVQVY